MSYFGGWVILWERGERWTFGGGGGGGLVQNRPNPDFRSREVGISGIGVD